MATKKTTKKATTKAKVTKGHKAEPTFNSFAAALNAPFKKGRSQAEKDAAQKRAEAKSREIDERLGNAEATTDAKPKATKKTTQKDMLVECFSMPARKARPKAEAAGTVDYFPEPAAKPKADANPKAAKKTDAMPKRLSALDAAAKLLAESGEPMSCKDLIEQMSTKGLWSSPNGKTPAATLYAAILREITVKGKNARFKKTDRGQFAAV